MKYFTIALFLGVITARDIELEEAKDAINALKISISKAGKKAIRAEAKDVKATWKSIETSQPIRNLEGSLKRWAKSKEALALKKLDQKFYSSPEGQRLIQEWKDVGKVLEENVYENKTGVHIPNSALDKIGDELDDVAYQYKSLEGGKWDKAYKVAIKDATSNKQAGAVGRRFESFKKSVEGQKLKKEMVDLKMAIKKNVKVTDIPENWKKNTNMLKIEVSKAGQAAIEKEANDVGQVWEAIDDSRPVRNMGASLERWGESDEVMALKELDKKFLASPEGKRLVMEWKDFGELLKKSIKETPNGIHISNSAMDDLSDELDDVADQYESLEGSKWDKAYQAGWKAATSNKEAAAVGRRWETFEKSDEWAALAKELKELDMAIKKNLKVTDLPEKTTNMLKITVKDSKPIEKEWNDVEAVGKAIQNSQPVRNLESSFQRWGTSPEVETVKKTEQAFMNTPRGKRMVQEWDDVFKTLDETVYHNKNGLYIDNDHVQDLSDELDDVEDEYKSLKKSKWGGIFKKVYTDAFTNDEFEALQRRGESFKHSKEGQALGKELDDFGKALDENVKVTDIPEEWKKDMFLF